MKVQKIISVLVFSLALSFSASAQVSGHQISLSGLSETVIVRRDDRSIPYIEARNDADLYFVQGYATASDRLWQMDLLRRVARGETAEIFGRQTLEEDKRWRRFGFARVSEEGVQYLAPELRSAIESYSKGVNAYIASLDQNSLPIEFKILQYKPHEWTPADSVIIGKILADALSSTYQRDLLRELLAGMDKAKLADLTDPVTPYDVVLFGKDKLWEPQRQIVGHMPAARVFVHDENGVMSSIENDMALRERSLRRIGLYADELAASNNWVISGKRTADGRAILANDPHLLAAAPGIWYLSHLSTPRMRVSGVTFPGVPGIILGHNEHIAWGATNVGPDVQDVYLETFRDDGKYKAPEGWFEASVRNEEIKYRANPLNPILTSENVKVTVTRHGPIITERGDKRYALTWTALDPKNSEFQAFYFLNRAKNWDEFKNALSNYGGATQNFVYADTNGNIGWYAAGKIPIRRKGEGELPYDGSTDEGDWVGYIPFNELPRLYNPPTGFIVTANQRIVGTDYKYQQMSRDAASPWRARRIFSRLNSDRKLTHADVSAIQLDAYNLPLVMLAKEMKGLKALSEANLKLFEAWDGIMTPDSSAALILNEVRNCLANKIADANKPVPSSMIRERILWRAIETRSKLWLPAEFTDWAQLASACVAESETSLGKRYGDRENWVWGKSWTARFPHPLAVAPLIGGQFATPNIPIAGSGQTPNVGSFVSMRHISTPGNWDETRFVIPLGQSGDPKSPYYRDQFDAWRTGTGGIFPFSQTSVGTAAKSNTLYRPAN